MPPIILEGPDAAIDTADLIVEVHELATYMNASFDSGASVEAAKQIVSAQSELEAFLGRPITVRLFEDVVVTVPPVPYGTAWSHGSVYWPHAPVVELVSLSANGAAVDVSAMRVRSWGIRSYDGAVGDLDTVVASYRAGLDGRNDQQYALLKNLVKRRAAREMIAREDDTQGTERTSDEGFSKDELQPQGGYTPAELQSCRRWKRRMVRP